MVDRCAGGKRQLAADRMLAVCGDVGDRRRRRADQSVVAHHHVAEHLDLQRVLRLRSVGEDGAPADGRAAVGERPNRETALDDVDLRREDLADHGHGACRSAGARAGRGDVRHAGLNVLRHSPRPGGGAPGGGGGFQPLLSGAGLVPNGQRAAGARWGDDDGEGRWVPLHNALRACDESHALRAPARRAGEDGHADADSEGERDETLCDGVGSHVLGRRAAAPVPVSS